MTLALELWCELLGQLGCVVCTRGLGGGSGRPHQHHVARGSGERHEFARAVLCEGHHTQFHSTMGGKAFCRLYRPPGDEEFGLVVWTIEDVARLLQRAPHTPLAIENARLHRRTIEASRKQKKTPAPP